MLERGERIIERIAGEMRRAGGERLPIRRVVQIIEDDLTDDGLDLRREPSLEAMKGLLTRAVRAAQPILPPLRYVVTRPRRTAVWSGLAEEGGPEEPTARPLEILLIEDNALFARITVGALRRGRIGHRLTWLTDGEQATAYLHQRAPYAHAPRPDLILLDLGLPRRDGREILAEIRSDYGLRSIPVVVMTASTAEEDRVASELLAVEAYLVKPVDLGKFLSLVRELRDYWRGDVVLPTV